MIKQKNMGALNINHKDIYLALVNEAYIDDDVEVMIGSAKNDEPIIEIKQNDRFLCMNSRYNSSYAAHRFMSQYINMKPATMAVMFGLGSGVYARELLSVDGNNIVIIYEPSISVFLEVINSIDISDVLSDTRVRLCVNGINSNRLGLVYKDNLTVTNANYNIYIALPKYIELFPEEYAFYCKEIEDKMNYAQAEINSFVNHGRGICESAIRNMKFLNNCYSMQDYVGKFPPELPAIIVAAGPSLEKNIDMLRMAKGRALIIAVDHALKPLLSRGILPDAVMAVDTFKNPELFDHPELSNIPMIVSMSLNTKAIEKANTNKIIFHSSSVSRWNELFEGQGSSIKKINSEGSVALDAMRTAIYWGMKTIIMVGQDLALKNDQMYADKQTFGKDQLSDSKTTYVKDIYGNDILTMKNFCIYIKGIEDMTVEFPDVHFVDATEGGALIRFTEILTLKSAIDEYCNEFYNIDELLNSAPKLFEDNKNVICALYSMKDNLLSIKEKVENAKRRCIEGEKLLRNRNYKVERLKSINNSIAEADDVCEHSEDAQLLDLYNAKIRYKYYLDYYDVEDDHIKESIRLYNKSTELYGEIEKSIPEIIKIVEETIIECEKRS